MQEYWYSGGSTGTLYLFLTFVEEDLLSWGGRRHPNSQGNYLLSLLENNQRNKAFLDQTGVIVRTNAIGALLQHHLRRHVYLRNLPSLQLLLCSPSPQSVGATMMK